MKSKKNILLVSLLALSIVPAGQSTWITIFNDSSKSYSKSKSDDVTKVAYTINDSKIITYYLTIESALEHTTSGTIYVIPGTNPTITRNCEIKSGVTLCIPYDDNGDGTHTDFTNLENQSNDGFADKDATAVTKNRKNLVTIKEGIILTNNGTLEVAGKVGVGAESNQRPSGFTLGDYCEILLENNAKIQNKGSINLYGYIKESSRNNGSSVEHSETGSMKMPFTIYDFRGGSYGAASYLDKSVMPFTYFDFPNCHVEQKFEYGSKLLTQAVLYGSSTYYKSDIEVLGTDDCLFKLSNQTTVTIKYNSIDCKYTTADVSNNTKISTANFTIVTIDGDFELSSFSVSAAGNTFNSSEVDCPISYKYQITQKSGTLTIPNKVKFLSGSSLTISEGAKCVMKAPVTFYQNYMPQISIGTVCPQNMGRAKLVVNGELTIDSSFGGVINSENSANKVITGENFIGSYQTYEVTKNSGMTAIQWDTHLELAAGYQTVSSSVSTFKLLKNKEYTITGNYWADAVNNDVTSYTFTPAYGRSESDKVRDYTVKVVTNFFETSSMAVANYEWSHDAGLTNWNSNGSQATFTTPAASNSSVDYKVTCKTAYTWLNGDTSEFAFEGTYQAYDSGCILPTALVLMADGSYKEAGLIRHGDMVIAFNHETGRLEPTQVIVNEHTKENACEYDFLHLVFDDGNSTDLVYMHGYFDLTLNKYVYLSIDNYLEYIGHEFVYVDSRLNISKVRLAYGEVKRMCTKIVSPVTANHLNIIVDNLLSITALVDGLFNIFEYEPTTIAFDKDKMQRDIDKYGLLGYETFEQYFPKKIYDLLPCKYLGVSIGKGLITWDTIEQYITRWKDQLLENM